MHTIRKEKNRVAAAASRDRNNSYILTLEVAREELMEDCQAYNRRVGELACSTFATIQIVKLLQIEACVLSNPTRLHNVEHLRQLEEMLNGLSHCQSVRLKLQKECDEMRKTLLQEQVDALQFELGELQKMTVTSPTKGIIMRQIERVQNELRSLRE